MKTRLILMAAVWLWALTGLAHGGKHRHLPNDDFAELERAESGSVQEEAYDEHPEKGVRITPDSPFCDRDRDGKISAAELAKGPKCQKSVDDGKGQGISATKIIADFGLKKGELILTIDDGPNKNVTPKILDLLAAYGIKAAFFVTGSMIEGKEALIQRIVREGHTIGNHTFSHDIPSITASTITDEIKEAHEAVLEALGNETDGQGQLLRDLYTRRMVFRMPGLVWSAAKAESMNSDTQDITYQYIGPIHANLGADSPAADWYCWSKKVDADECADRYFNQIVSVGRGVILTHDIYYSSSVPERNTYYLLETLLRRLNKEGGGITNANEGKGVWTFRQLVDMPVLDKFDPSLLDENKPPKPVDPGTPIDEDIIRSFAKVGTLRDESLGDAKNLTAEVKAQTDLHRTTSNVIAVRDLKKTITLTDPNGKPARFKLVEIVEVDSGNKDLLNRRVYIWDKVF